VIRLNIESRGDQQILQENQDALLALIESV